MSTESRTDRLADEFFDEMESPDTDGELSDTMYHTVLNGTARSDFPQWVETPSIAHQLTTDTTGLTP